MFLFQVLVLIAVCGFIISYPKTIGKLIRKLKDSKKEITETVTAEEEPSLATEEPQREKIGYKEAYQKMEELCDQLQENKTKLNNNYAEVVSYKIKLTEDLKTLQKKVKDDERKIKTLLSKGDEETARTLALVLARDREQLEFFTVEAKKAAEAAETAKNVKRGVEQKICTRAAEIRNATQRLKISEMKSDFANVIIPFDNFDIEAEIASALESFSLRSAKGEAKLEVALESPEGKEMAVTSKLTDIDADAILEEFRTKKK